MKYIIKRCYPEEIEDSLTCRITLNQSSILEKTLARVNLPADAIPLQIGTDKWFHNGKLIDRLYIDYLEVA